MKRTPLKTHKRLERKTKWEYERKPMRKRGETKRKKVKRYNAHMKSKYIADLKVIIWERDKGICQDCQQPAPKKGWHAAHTTYVRFGHELPEDLKVNCRECNTKERASRAWYLGPIQSTDRSSN